MEYDFEDWRDKSVTDAQMRKIRELGGDDWRPSSRGEASDYIDELLAQKRYEHEEREERRASLESYKVKAPALKLPKGLKILISGIEIDGLSDFESNFYNVCQEPDVILYGYFMPPELGEASIAIFSEFKSRQIQIGRIDKTTSAMIFNLPDEQKHRLYLRGKEKYYNETLDGARMKCKFDILYTPKGEPEFNPYKQIVNCPQKLLDEIEAAKQAEEKRALERLEAERAEQERLKATYIEFQKNLKFNIVGKEPPVAAPKKGLFAHILGIFKRS